MYFGSAPAQRAYFYSHRVGSFVTDTFYPPYYKNSIRLSTDDVNFDSEINYCSFEYNNHEYYYFIKEVSYISQDVIDILIEMDTIQTFMFNIKLNSAIIERTLIERMTANGHINRDYIRDNFGDGGFVFYSKTLVSHKAQGVTDKTIGYFVIKTTSSWGSLNFKGKYINNNNLIYNGISYYLLVCPVYTLYNIPEKVIDVNDAENWVGFKSRTKANNALECLISVASDPTVVEWYFLPGNCLHSLMTIDSNNNIKLNDSNLSVANFGADSNISNNGYSMPVIVLNNLNSNILNYPIDHGYNLSFLRNANKNEMFSTYYEPSLMDNNYMEVTYGEDDSFSSINLFDLDYPILYLIYYGEIYTGNRAYYIDLDPVSRADLGMFVKYTNMTISDSPMYFDIISDSWKQWVAYNKGTLGVTAAKTAARLAMLMAGGSASAGSFNTAVSGILGNPSSFDKRFKNSSVLRKKPSSKLQALYADRNVEQASEAGSYVNTALDAVSASAFNAFAAPSKGVSTGNFANDIATGSGDSFITIKRISNYDSVARYYQKYGNRVDKHIDEILTFIQVLNRYNIRYYFGYLKFNYCDVHLNMLESESLIEDIKNRLYDGVRYWNVNKNDVIMCDYQHDNAEV